MEGGGDFSPPSCVRGEIVERQLRNWNKKQQRTEQAPGGLTDT